MKISRYVRMAMCFLPLLLATTNPTWEANHEVVAVTASRCHYSGNIDSVFHRSIITVGEGMFDKSQFRNLIERVLKEANLYSESAVELLMLTAAAESKLGTYLRQVRGPALGVFQMEPATHNDLWKNFIAYKDKLLNNIWVPYPMEKRVEQLEYDLKYAILMARVHYLRVPTPLPAADDIDGLAQYWKDHYNTHLGKGTPEKARSMYERYAV